MSTDFLQAYKRHRRDAIYLRDGNRLDNADHLCGLAAECGLKRLMLRFGMPVTGSGVPEKPDRKHVDELKTPYESYAQGQHAPTYAWPVGTAFDNWNVSDRYAADSVSEAEVDAHLQALENIDALIRQAKQDGLIP